MPRLGSQRRKSVFTGVHKQRFTEIPFCPSPSVDLGYFHLCCPHRIRQGYKSHLSVLTLRASICKLRFPAAPHSEIKSCPFHRHLFDEHTASSQPEKQLLCPSATPSSQFKAAKVSLWLYLRWNSPDCHTLQLPPEYSNVPPPNGPGTEALAKQSPQTGH